MNNEPFENEAEKSAGTTTAVTVSHAQTKLPADPVTSNQPSFFRRHASPVWGRVLAGLIDAPVISLVAAVVSATASTTDIDPLFGPIVTALLASFLYHMALEISPWQATLGKRITGLRTVRLDGESPSVLQVAGRSLMRWLECMLLGLPYLVCLFVPHRATLHDLVTGTRTIATKNLTTEERYHLAAAPAKVWTWQEKTCVGVAYSVLMMMLMMFAIAINITAMVRDGVTDAFQDVRNTMRQIEGFHATAGRFPPSLSDVGGPVTIHSPNLASVAYTPTTGAIVLKFKTEMAILGPMYVVPIVGGDLKRPKDITWMCAGTEGFIQSYLPRDCMTISGLALQRIRAKAAR